jgi:UDP-N-acetylglucosamine acyltransferase
MASSDLIHSAALISPLAEIAAGVEIGPFAIVDEGVRIGPGCRIGAHAHVLRGVDMGPDNTVDRGAVIGGDPQSLGFDRATLSGVRIGEGNFFREHVTVHRSTLSGGLTIVGNHNFLMAGAHLGHDSVIGDHNVLANNVLVAGHVTIGSRCFLGGGAGVHQFIRIGDFAMIQGNGSISQDIPPYCTASGLNVVDGINVVGLRRAGFDSAARLEIKRAWNTAYKSPAGPVKGAALALESGAWSEAARALLSFMAAGGKKGIACPRRRRGETRQESDPP